MSKNDDKKLSTDSYKGVRDFYPDDQSVQEYIFYVWETTLESFGYEKYNASMLEYTDLYKAKSGQDIVQKETYQFTDRGGREVTIRPEMTPTVARMVAKKKRELSFPLRWYSIPNIFRYERPQKGRLRDFWQLNVDLFGIDKLDADAETIEIAYRLLMNFGLNDGQFEIQVSNKELLNKSLADLGLNPIEQDEMRRLLDKKDKIEDFDEQAEKILGKPFNLKIEADETVKVLIDKLKKRGISNVKFNPYMARGFDYYTGVIFEIFDTGSENNRAIFGGGRYDNLLEIFGGDDMPAVGFGMGDVVIKDMLETYNLVPRDQSMVDIGICSLDEIFNDSATELAVELRKAGLNVSVDYSNKKIGDQIKKVDKKNIPYVICIGENEADSKEYTVKDLESGEEIELKIEEISKFVKNNFN